MLKRLGVAVLVSTLLMASACSSSTKTSSPPSTSRTGSNSTPIDLLVVSDQGDAAAAGLVAEATGVQAAANQINSSGGLLGRQLKVHLVNYQGDATVAASAVQAQLSSGPLPAFAWLTGLDANDLAIAPMTTEKKILSFGASPLAALNDPKTYPYWFSTAYPTSAHGQAIAQTLSQQGAKKVGLISTNDSFGTDALTQYAAAMEQKGMTVSKAQYGVTDVDLRAPLQKVTAGHPDHLVVVGYGPAIGRALQARSVLGITAPTLLDPVAALSGVLTGVPQSQLSGVSELQFAVDVASGSSQRPSVASLESAVNALGGFKQPIYAYANGWDAVQLWALAVKQAGTTDTLQVTKALENLKQPAPDSRPYVIGAEESYSATNHAFTANITTDYRLAVPGPQDTNGQNQPEPSS